MFVANTSFVPLYNILENYPEFLEELEQALAVDFRWHGCRAFLLDKPTVMEYMETVAKKDIALAYEFQQIKEKMERISDSLYIDLVYDDQVFSPPLKTLGEYKQEEGDKIRSF